MTFRRFAVPIGIGLLIGLAGCSLLDRATEADPAVSAPARAELTDAAGALGTALGGPLGGLLGNHAMEALIAGYLVYRRANEKKRYSRAVKRTVIPSVVAPAAAPKP